MNVKKIIKGVFGLGAVAGIAYAAFKLGESNGEINERFREKYGDDEDDIELDDDEDEFRFYDNMDEPDDECLAPSHEATAYYFVSPEKVKGMTKPQMKKVVRNILCCKYVSNKTIRDILGVDYDKAAEVLRSLEKAGLIGADNDNHKMPVFITYRDFDNLYR